MLVRQFKAMCTLDVVVKTIEEEISPATIADEGDVLVVVVNVIMVRGILSVIVFASSAALLLLVRVSWFTLQSEVHSCYYMTLSLSFSIDLDTTVGTCATGKSNL